MTNDNNHVRLGRRAFLKHGTLIHYCTLVAMIEGSGPENNGYSLMEIEPNGTIHLTGFRKQKSHEWERRG